MAVKSKGLGRGLSALIPEEAIQPEEKKESTLFLDVDKIRRNEEQPRYEFEKEALEELSESIKQFGILQPLVVMPDGEYYKVVAGERRLRASIMAGLSEVPVIIREFDDKSLLQAALIENIQREDLSEIECAKAYKKLSEDYNMTQEEISKGVGKSRSAITNTMRLLMLPDEVIKLIENKQLSAGHARAVLSVENDCDRVPFAEMIVKNALSVREAEKLSKTYTSKVQNTTPKITANKAAYILKFEEELSEVLGSKVTIDVKSKGGCVKIDYYSNEDLERIMEAVKAQR